MLGWSNKREVTVTALDAYIREISKIRDEWLDDPEDELWFRGEDEKHSETTLLPELYRSQKPTGKALAMENRLFEEFKRCGVQYSEFDTEDEWNWYSAMQHHGGPTRLLDWSGGSLMAAHFSTRFKTSAADLQVGAVVYVLDPHWLGGHIDELRETVKHRKVWDARPENKSIPEDDRDAEYENLWLPGSEADFKADPLPNHPFLLDTEQITRRVASQRSRFMVFGADREFLRSMASDDRAKIRRLVFPANCIPKIQTDIRDCGITESVIFPDLDGMGRETKQRWQQFKARS